MLHINVPFIVQIKSNLSMQIIGHNKKVVILKIGEDILKRWVRVGQGGATILECNADIIKFIMNSVTLITFSYKMQ